MPPLKLFLAESESIQILVFNGIPSQERVTLIFQQIPSYKENTKSLLWETWGVFFWYLLFSIDHSWVLKPVEVLHSQKNEPTE